MLKTLIYIVLFFIAFAFIARTSVSFNPFKITFEHKMYALGWLFLTIGMVIILTDSRRQGMEIGYKEGSNDCLNIIRKELNSARNADKENVQIKIKHINTQSN